MKQLPTKVFLTIEEPGTEIEFLHAVPKIGDIAVEIGERKIVGEYSLTRVREFQGVLEEVKPS
jgi:hypothetical protein